jgi:hypothetical protein
MELSAAEFGKLLKALLGALERSELDEVSRIGLGTNLAEFVSENAANRQAVIKLIRRAEARDMVDRLVVAAREVNPTNRLLQDVAIELTVAVDPSDALQRIVAQNRTVNIVTWRERIAELEGQVCSIEVPGGGGTGFLVAPDLVMTNHHVVQPIVDGGDSMARRVRICFDYKTAADGRTVKEPVELSLPPDPWLVDSSPSSPIDVQVGAVGDPNPDELDYALIQLPRDFGDEPIAGIDSEGPPRGWIPIPEPDTAPPKEGELALILQHPRGEPLQLASDVVTKVNGNGTRLRYLVDTDGGSSGAPVFDIDWNLVALHHSGDPDFSRDATYNEGIPIGKIAGMLDDRKLRDRLGAVS